MLCFSLYADASPESLEPSSSSSTPGHTLILTFSIRGPWACDFFLELPLLSPVLALSNFVHTHFGEMYLLVPLVEGALGFYRFFFS